MVAIFWYFAHGCEPSAWNSTAAGEIRNVTEFEVTALDARAKTNSAKIICKMYFGLDMVFAFHIQDHAARVLTENCLNHKKDR
jgi:hypothetical protein